MLGAQVALMHLPPKLAALAMTALLALSAGAAHADVDVRIPFDMSGAHNFMGMGLAGLGLDVGERVSSDVYVGAQADYELVLDVGAKDPSVTPSALHRLRAGGELRYYVADGLAEVTSGGCDCGCPPTTAIVQRRVWLGVAGGLETIDQGATSGRYGTATIGFDFSAPGGSGTRYGFYLSAELSEEPSLSIPSVAAGDWDPLASLNSPTHSATTNVPTSDDTTTSVGVAIGMRIGF
jgi:hypothetical protein